ncbi:MAG: CorA family divalent cation transporter [Patescibacteria group bacterium]
MAKATGGTIKTPRGYQVVESDGITWINVSRPTLNTLKHLQKLYPFILDIDLQDCLPPFQRPKLLERDQYLFMVLLYPVYDRREKTVRPVEIDFFIGRDFVVTSHAEEMEPLIDLAQDCIKDERTCDLRLGNETPTMMFNLLHELLISVFPLLTRLTNDILLAERQIFDESGHDTVKQILRIKSNIVQCRQAMQGHKMVIRKFVQRSRKMFKMDDMAVYFEDLVGHTKEIWDYLENDKETIDAVYDSHTSLVTHSTSQASQRLAALALIIFPTTLVAAIFAMAADNMPIKGHPYDFEIMLAVVLMTMFGTLAYIKWKRWL